MSRFYFQRQSSKNSAYDTGTLSFMTLCPLNRSRVLLCFHTTSSKHARSRKKNLKKLEDDISMLNFTF